MKIKEEHCPTCGNRICLVLKRSIELWNSSSLFSHRLPFLNDGILHLPLPNANHDWSFKVFDISKKLCEEFCDIYLEHDLDKREEMGNTLAINVRSWV